jgi:hypothetical protein
LLPGAARASADDLHLLVDVRADDDWTKGDTAAEVAFGLTMLGDYLQTRQITRSGREANPVMGSRGERVSPSLYFPVALALHALVARELPQPYRGIFQVVSIGVEIGVVGRNLHLGWTVRL